jgi:hypothetical protein
MRTTQRVNEVTKNPAQLKAMAHLLALTISKHDMIVDGAGGFEDGAASFMLNGTGIGFGYR